MKKALPFLALCLVACGGEPPATDTSHAERALPVQAVEVAPRDLSRTVRVSAPVEPLRASNHIDAASYETARAELAVARSEVDLWQTRVDFGEVRANVDGTVITRHVEPGEAINRYQPLFEIADLSALVVRLGVSELDVRDLNEGSSVIVEVDAIGASAPLEGRVRRIFPAAETASRLITVEVEIADAHANGVRPGYLARATLQVDQRADVLAVPAGALAETDNGHYVMVITDDDRLERREVRAGVSRGGWREIESGLRVGERVVATNPLDLSEGTRVRIMGWAG